MAEGPIVPAAFYVLVINWMMSLSHEIGAENAFSQWVNEQLAGNPIGKYL